MSDRWELSGYVVGDLLGFGRRGQVWRGRVASTGEPVALKRLGGLDAATVERLRGDAAVLGSLATPHVVRVRDVVVAGDGDVVLVTDLADGGSLRGVLDRRGRLAAPEVVTLLAPLAQALADAHERGLVHGAVSPANVVFTSRGRPLLADFGLVPALGGRVPAADDVRDLAVLGSSALSSAAGASAHVPAALGAALRAALHDDPSARPDARAFAETVLASAPAAPIGLVGRSSRPGGPAPGATETPENGPPAASADASPSAGGRPVTARPDCRDGDPARLRQWAMAGAAAVVAIVLGVAWGRHDHGPAAATLRRAPALEGMPAAAPAGAGATSVVPQPWGDVVARLDGLRAAAYRAGDPHLLDAVYVPASPALLVDRTRLQQLVARGWRARGFDARVQSVRVEASSGDSARLRVVDVLSGYDLVDDAGLVVAQGESRGRRAFVLVLNRVGPSWRVQSVRPA